MQLKQIIKTKSGFNIEIVLEEFSLNPIATVIECHGGITNNAEHSVKASEKLINLLGQKNINFVAIQFSHNGTYEDQNPEDTIFSDRVKELESVIDYVQEKYKCQIVLLGSSLGGHIISNANLNQNIKAIILNCPALKAFESVKSLIEKSEFDNWKSSGFATWNNFDPKYPILKLPWKFFEDLSENIGFDKIKNINIPILIFHGTADKITNISNSREIAKLNKNIELIEVEGGGHRFDMGENQWEKLASEFIFEKLNLNE